MEHMKSSAQFSARPARRISWLLPAFIVAVVLTLSLASPLIWPTRDLPVILVAGVLGIGAIALFLRWPPLGLIALVVGSLVIDFEVATSAQAPINISVILAPLLIGLWILSLTPLAEGKPMLQSKVVSALFTFLAIALFAFGVGQLPWYPFPGAPIRAQLAGLGIFFFSAGIFLVAAHQIGELRWLRWLTWTFILLGAIHLLGQLVPSLGAILADWLQEGASGSLFWLWLVALSASQAAVNRDLGVPWRVGLGLIPLGAIYLNMFAGRAWVSGWLPATIALAVVLLLAVPRFSIPVLVAAVPLALVRSAMVQGFVLVGDNEYSLETRLRAWEIIAEIVKVNPLLGLGPANYYSYTPAFPILGWYVNFSSHNNYIDLVAQTGFFGLAAFLWFIAELGRAGWQLLRRVPEGFARAYTVGAIGGLVGTLAAGFLGDWFLPFVYNISLTGFRSSILGWLFMGGLLALWRMYPGGAKSDQAGTTAGRVTGT